MKKVFLHAYQEVNFGDDLFIENILSRYKDIKFYIEGNKEYERYFSSYNLSVVNCNNKIIRSMSKLWKSCYPRLIHELKKGCNAIVYIGGSIFIEYPSWKNVLNWWNYQVDNYPFYVLGANFGPYQDEEYKLSMNNVFTKMKDVCFRDKYSYSLFNNEKVRYAPDILFNQKMPIVDRVDKKVFVSLIDCDSKDEGSNKFDNLSNVYSNSIAEVLKKYIEDDFEVVLVAFCEKEGDCKVNENVLRLLSQDELKQVREVIYDGYNRNEILKELVSSSYVIGTRFHSIVLSMVANKPFFPIIYSKKTLNMLDDLGYKGNYIDIKNIEQLTYDYSIKNLKDNYIVDIEEYRKEAEKHYLYLDKLLK